MQGWKELAAEGRYQEAEAEMLLATDRGEGLFPENEIRAEFYEAWGDALTDRSEAVAKLKEAENNWRMFAACSTSGGEGTARMSEVNRVEEKLERLNADR